MLDSLLDPVLGWVLNLPLWLGILILSFILTSIINLIYKYATDQEEMKRLKKKIKDSQAEMKKHRSDPKKLQKIQKDAMQVNMKYTTKSLKPTLYTFIPLIIIFAWMNANLAFVPIDAGEQFEISALMSEPSLLTLETQLDIVGEPSKETIESFASWKLSGPAGLHNFSIITQDNESVHGAVLIGEHKNGDSFPDGANPRNPIKVDDPFKSVDVGYQKAKPFGDFSIFGYEPGWLFTYIIFSILLSILTRKLFKIY